MAKTKKKITVASMMRAMNADKQNKDIMTIGEGEDQFKVTVKKKLNLHERADMVSSIVDMVWARDENDNEVFAPYLRKFAYDFNILNYFTDIPLPDDMDKVWEFIDNTNITVMVIDFVGGGYIDNIIREANEAIEYRKAKALKRSKLDNILDSLSDVISAVSNKTQNLDVNGILDLTQAYAPELKGEVENIIRSQIAEQHNAESVVVTKPAD